MPEVREEEIYNALLKFRGEGKVLIVKAEALLSLIPQDTHKRDRPDTILWVDITLRLFGQEFNVRIPIPIEGEKNNSDAANPNNLLTSCVAFIRPPMGRIWFHQNPTSHRFKHAQSIKRNQLLKTQEEGKY